MRRTIPAFLKISLGLALPAVLSTACSDDAAENDSGASSESGETTADPSATSPESTLTVDPDSSSSDPDTAGSSSTTDPDPDSSSSTGEPSECGNGAIDEGEECDGTELVGRDCGDFDFAGGELSCTAECTYDTSQCSSVCGDGIIDADEDCEPDDLGGADCVSEGFDDGVLACDAQCGFDDSGCIIMSCGNDVAEGMEACDGADLRGEDCLSQGFGSGTLACARNCGDFDDSGCIPAEICDNEVDDDLDELTDCEDPDCVGTVECASTVQLIVDCDPGYCTLTPGGGPNGGDLCSCTIPALDHPVADNVPDASCFIGAPASDLLFQFTTGVDAFSVSTCNTNPGDSAVAGYATDPSLGGVPTLGCNDDAPGSFPSYCSELTPNANGPALPTLTQGASELWVQVDEWNPGSYWDGETDRVVDIELINGSIEVCDDGLDNDLDGAPDCTDLECVGDAACSGRAELLQDCDATYCTFEAAAGANGGDLCTCVIPAGEHPTDNDLGDASCFFGNPGIELLWRYDTTGYAGFTVSSCEADQGDSSIAAFDGLIGAGGVQIACDEDATGEIGFCSELVDSLDAGAGIPALVPASNDLQIIVDELNSGVYWNGVSQRSFQIELLVPLPEVCNDGVDNDFDGDTDCDDVECQALPECEPVEELVGCDGTYCTFTADAGPNGGDLCVCVIPPGNHPSGNDYADASCFGLDPTGIDLRWTYDTTGYSDYTISSCEANQGDSSIAAFDGVPGVGVELACDEDASGESGFCSELLDSLNNGPALPTALPASNDLQVLIDEWGAGNYWNGTIQRTFQIELIP